MQELISLTTSLPQPADFFSGHGSIISTLPRNILLFKRITPPRGLAHHHRHVLIAAFKGTGTVIIDGLVHAVGPGQGILILPHQGHDYGRFDCGHICWLFITFEIEETAAMQTLRSVPCDYDEGSLKLLEECCRQFLAVRAGSAEAGDMLALALGEILCRLLRRAGQFASRRSQEAVPARQELLRRTVAMVHENLDRQLSVAQVADRLMLSGSRLRAVFREETGISLGEFMSRKRMDRARSLLRLSDMNISEVATACGFGTVYSFSRAFAQRNGEPPTTYRARVRAAAGQAQPRKS